MTQSIPISSIILNNENIQKYNDKLKAKEERQERTAVQSKSLYLRNYIQITLLNIKKTCLNNCLNTSKWEKRIIQHNQLRIIPSI